MRGGKTVRGEVKRVRGGRGQGSKEKGKRYEGGGGKEVRIKSPNKGGK